MIQETHRPTRHYWSSNVFGGSVGIYGAQDLALRDRSLISSSGDDVVKIWGPGWCDFGLHVVSRSGVICIVVSVNAVGAARAGGLALLAALAGVETRRVDPESCRRRCSW